jgi:hypothetical protein
MVFLIVQGASKIVISKNVFRAYGGAQTVVCKQTMSFHTISTVENFFALIG